MARGHQKVQAQQLNAKKASKKKNSHSSADQKKSAQAALIFQCSVCKSMMPDPKTYAQHFENKHPGKPLPAELKEEA